MPEDPTGIIKWISGLGATSMLAMFGFLFYKRKVRLESDFKDQEALYEKLLESERTERERERTERTREVEMYKAMLADEVKEKDEWKAMSLRSYQNNVA